MIVTCGCDGFPAPGVVCGVVSVAGKIKKCLAPDDYICRFKTVKAPEPNLKEFCMKVLDASCDGSGVEAWNIQEWATELGLLEPVEVTEPCSPIACMCVECDNIPGTCYRPVKFLAEGPASDG